MNKFKAIMIALNVSFESFISSALLEERVSRLRIKIVLFIVSILIFLCVVFTEMDVSSFGVGGLVILGSIYLAVLLSINYYFDSNFNPDGSLKKKKDASE
ncbi:hypothetical protein B9J09_04320 [Xylella fastidiosa subsp. pauca]|uniref:hypothetical protein n=1 Tax=Xylella fastidiosa TaxID=2371 RepID=UPI0005836E13|nr:hypothetical protein [Xylella fastidiosa]ARO68368.1 hypothetical protein B9J09_04320 [Xylella fastidiosa subsp. pauca]AVI20507.1 hypothetical protein BCV75_04065 [Xylella fastidiosa]AVI23738.1 hypothetical protein BC375_04105 [Xylella fastidiosa]KIA57801.1 hypothetical protein RA12_08995 [Xylella fastidiosa]KXB10542.1 hypothetical protein ADT33_10990 [Xylella fastidiosa]